MINGSVFLTCLWEIKQTRLIHAVVIVATSSSHQQDLLQAAAHGVKGLFSQADYPGLDKHVYSFLSTTRTSQP
jgi:CheY-like chemotaxis protein